MPGVRRRYGWRDLLFDGAREGEDLTILLSHRAAPQKRSPTSAVSSARDWAPPTRKVSFTVISPGNVLVDEDGMVRMIEFDSRRSDRNRQFPRHARLPGARTAGAPCSSFGKDRLRAGCDPYGLCGSQALSRPLEHGARSFEASTLVPDVDPHRTSDPASAALIRGTVPRRQRRWPRAWWRSLSRAAAG